MPIPSIVDIPDMPQHTSIKVLASTRDRLASIGRKLDSFDDIIQRLLDEHEQHEQRKKPRG